MSDTATGFRERLQAAHTESIGVGPTGPLILFLASLSSATILLGRGIRLVYRRCRGYA